MIRNELYGNCLGLRYAIHEYTSLGKRAWNLSLTAVTKLQGCKNRKRRLTIGGYITTFPKIYIRGRRQQSDGNGRLQDTLNKRTDSTQAKSLDSETVDHKEIWAGLPIA